MGTTTDDCSLPTSPGREEISLRELVGIVWQGKWLIFVVTALFGLTFGIVAWKTPRLYEAAILVSPTSESPGGGQLGGMSGMASQFGGLASLAGISLSGDSKKWESVAVLKSKALTEQYIRDNNLLPVLFSKLWDSANGRWIPTNPKAIPTLWQGSEYFSDIRAVESDARTGLVTLTVEWKDPQLAARWANDLVSLANAYLRDSAIEQSEQNIAYLNEQAAKTDVVGIRLAIFALMQNEINRAMLARGTKQYAFKVIDAAVAPEAPSSLSPRIWLVIGAMVGLLLALLALFIRTGWNKQP